MKSVRFLEKLQEKTGLNDTALGKELGVTQAAVSQYKSGKRIMDDETCIAVAMALEINPMEVIGAACIDRAAKSGQKSLWEVFMSRTATAASVLFALLAINFLSPQNAEAASRLASQPVTTAEHFALCKILYVSCDVLKIRPDA